MIIIELLVLRIFLRKRVSGWNFSLIDVVRSNMKEGKNVLSEFFEMISKSHNRNIPDEGYFPSESRGKSQITLNASNWTNRIGQILRSMGTLKSFQTPWN